MSSFKCCHYVMIIIIPIGGSGQRFQENGYKRPKALINVHGRSMISKLLDNLNTDKVDYVLITCLFHITKNTKNIDLKTC